MTRLFTFVLEYAGGTYIAQAKGEDISSAARTWLKMLTDSELSDWRLSRSELQELLDEDRFVRLEKVENVWCTSRSGEHGLVLINVIETISSV